jgi:hypothetical protein
MRTSQINENTSFNLDGLPDSIPNINCLADNVGHPFCLSSNDTSSFIISGRILDIRKDKK